MTDTAATSPTPPPLDPGPVYAAPPAFAQQPPAGYAAPAQGYYQPQGYAQAPGYYAVPTGAPSTNVLAIISLVAGIAGILAFPIVASIVAIVLGVMARKQILLSREGGAGMAMAGLVMGWIGVAFWGLLFLLWIAAMALSVGGAIVTS